MVYTTHKDCKIGDDLLMGGINPLEPFTYGWVYPMFYQHSVSLHGTFKKWGP